ncbi:MAG TPA: radical SAM protein [Pyrinomonadaceae bacterium]|nr:radical SAM protein [Pyrinomonadaceae bacterium]
MTNKLKIIILKPSKYGVDGFVERFRWGFMPNSTVPYIRSMTPPEIDGTPVEVHTIDEYVHTDVEYFSLLTKAKGEETLLALVGVQSHQFQRALDLAAYAQKRGCMVVIGGPHSMTCDTSLLHGRGISFALAEAELIWPSILRDALAGELRPVYGQDQRWQRTLEAPVVIPPSQRDLQRYFMAMLGLYPARGCPFLCNYCSVIKIAGRAVRSQSIDTTIASLKVAKAAGVKLIMFTSDNFNKYADAEELLNAMIEEEIHLPFLVQCDTQIMKQEKLVELLSRAGCFQMFLGVESFSRETLLAARKTQNRPELYENILQLCRRYRIYSHFSTIIGFPQDTAPGIQQHIKTICELSPTWASFYILCPIPGTEQYDDFLSKGWITEKNLDRFDTTYLTWTHPTLSRHDLQTWMFRAYRRFESLKHTQMNLSQLSYKRGGLLSELMTSIGYSLFNNYSALRRKHPMSGGFKRKKLDHLNDFLHLRRNLFDLSLVPLPQSLALPEADQILNRIGNSALKHALATGGAPAVV